MTARYVIAHVDDTYDALGPLEVASLPPGHHHVHVGEDGTITVVQMRQWGFTPLAVIDRVMLWTDAPKETDT